MLVQAQRGASIRTRRGGAPLSRASTAEELGSPGGAVSAGAGGWVTAGVDVATAGGPTGSGGLVVAAGSGGFVVGTGTGGDGRAAGDALAGGVDAFGAVDSARL